MNYNKFKKACIIAWLLILLSALRLLADDSSSSPPSVQLTVPHAFKTGLTISHYAKGEDLMHDDIYKFVTVAPLTEYSGTFGSAEADQSHNHGWTVYVFAERNPRVAEAIKHARDGYEANLNVEVEFFHLDEPSYMYARFKRKHFRWGRAVSFFSQFTQDTALYVPHNGHLTYEIWGMTNDRRFTVVATCAVSHPKLANWSSAVRDAPTMEALRNDRDYKLVEKCKPKEFEPSLTAIDRMIDTLRVK